MNEDLIEKLRAAITGLDVERMASFHGRFLAYLDAGLADDLSAVGWVDFSHCDAMALQRAWQRRG